MNQLLMRFDPKDGANISHMVLLDDLVRKILNTTKDCSQIDIEVNFKYKETSHG